MMILSPAAGKVKVINIKIIVIVCFSTCIFGFFVVK